jgi:predicted DNA-binding transcriptional regulator YafY
VLETPGRLLRLLGLFQARPEWGAPELAERLGVTERTVRRDVTRLRDLGYPVEARPGVTGGYPFASGAAMPPLLLDDEEASQSLWACAWRRTERSRGWTRPPSARSPSSNASCLPV